jgi:hypothetical protein
MTKKTKRKKKALRTWEFKAWQVDTSRASGCYLELISKTKQHLFDAGFYLNELIPVSVVVTELPRKKVKP